MKKYLLATILVPLALFMSGCSEEGDEGEESNTTSSSGWHFQGRDCLACHNVDLGQEKHLVFGGTLYKSSNVPDVNDLDNMCDADLAVEFLDGSWNVVYSTANYYDADTKGNKGRGNIFLLDRLFNATLNGSYTVRIVERTSGLNMAQSNMTSHDFSGGAYSIDNSKDFTNRLACNACHNGSVTDYLNVQLNANLCN